jgi:uncharacterized protein YlzI (FlbEa/FlbD family)
MAEKRRTEAVNMAQVLRLSAYNSGQSEDLAKTTIHFINGEVLNVRESIKEVVLLMNMEWYGG